MTRELAREYRRYLHLWLALTAVAYLFAYWLAWTTRSAAVTITATLIAFVCTMFSVHAFTRSR